MKKNTQKSFNKRIASYGALALAIAGVSDAAGQIEYTDVDPDEVLTGTRFLLDLNGDSATDFEISNDGVFSGATPGTTARVYTSNSGSILGINGGNYNYPFALSEGDLIDDTQLTWITNSNYQTLNWQGCAYANSQWCDGQVDKYLGLRITIGGDQHYGWVRLDIPADASSITVKDYAINTVANEGIEAGDMGSTAGVADNNFEGFKHFVTNNQLNLIANTSMENVSIHNLLGQQVFTEKLSSTNEVINLSGLQAGVYITAVTINGTTKSVKIVKN